MNGNRIEALDYLRGVMALSVMAYHYTVWAGVSLAADSMLSKLGIYAVSVFYILSGLSLAVAYRGKIDSCQGVARFLVKRIFRIAPLLWLSVFSVMLLQYLGSHIQGGEFEIPYYRLFLNLTLLFGFIDPMPYMSTGAWSIGNEIVFYVIFPFLFLLALRWSWAWSVAFFIGSLVGLYFAFSVLDQSKGLEEQWSIYVNPFNQLFLFLGGIVIGIHARPESINTKKGVFFALVVAALFWVYPVEGDRIHLVSGFSRCYLPVLLFVFVWLVYGSAIHIGGKVAMALAFSGEACYSIYLLHPLVAIPMKYVFTAIGVPPITTYVFAAVVTLVLSRFTFKYIEKPMMRVGAEISNLIRKRQGVPG